jgi:hypothetical protein
MQSHISGLKPSLKSDVSCKSSVCADMHGRKKRRATRTHDSGSDPESPPEDPTMQLVQYQPQQNDFTKPFLNMLKREGNPYISGEEKVGPQDWQEGPPLVLLSCDLMETKVMYCSCVASVMFVGMLIGFVDYSACL